MRALMFITDTPGHVGIASATNLDSDSEVLAGLMDGLALPDLDSE